MEWLHFQPSLIAHVLLKNKEKDFLWVLSGWLKPVHTKILFLFSQCPNHKRIKNEDLSNWSTRMEDSSHKRDEMEFYINKLKEKAWPYSVPGRCRQ